MVAMDFKHACEKHIAMSINYETKEPGYKCPYFFPTRDMNLSVQID
jgi:hypothetical protein